MSVTFKNLHATLKNTFNQSHHEFRKARGVFAHSRAVFPWLPLNEKGDCLLPKKEDTDVT